MKISQTLLFMAAVLLFSASGDVKDLKKCLRFKVPDQQSVITVPVCTLGVDTACKDIERAEIRVRYFPKNADTAVITTLGALVKPPFVKVWDLSTIPNQLSVGIGVIIEVSFTDGDVFGLRREGIFLAHQPITYLPEAALSYEYPGTKDFPGDTIRIPSSRPSVAALARMYWNEKAVTIMVSVHNPLFDSSQSEKILEKTGIEILIDPAKKRRPFPTEEIVCFDVPLAGRPYRVTYQPLFRDSATYQLKQTNVFGNFDYTIEKHTREGFVVSFSIPSYLFGRPLPQEMGYNIIVKTADRKGNIAVTSLVNSGFFNNYSPLLWPALTLLPKPIFKVRWLIVLVTFLTGLLVPLFAYSLVTTVTKDRPRVLVIKRPETEKQAFQKVKDVIDRHVTEKDVSAAAVAAELNMAVNQVKTMTKKMTGLSFRQYAMYLRTEIVCERLRSSHANEASIAQSCGFSNVKEMERYFRRFYHMKPLKFRQLQQIRQEQ